MIVVDTRIHHGNDYTRIPRRYVPRLIRIDIRIHQPPRLTDIVQPPLIDKTRIVRHKTQFVLVVRLGIDYIRRRIEPHYRIRKRRTLRQLNHSQTRNNVVVFLRHRSAGNDIFGHYVPYRPTSERTHYHWTFRRL